MDAPVFDAVAPPRLADDPGFGYMSCQRGDLPLEDVRLHADIAGLAASVDLRATFRNDGTRPVSATYVFPVPELGSVSSLQIRTGSSVIDGWLRERAEARAAYAAGRFDRDAAAILEQEREDVVTISVGTIAPGERVEVRLTLHARLTYADGQIFFRFPLVVAPRHMPGARLAGDPVGQGTAEDTHLVPDASRVSPPVRPGGQVRLSVSITVATDVYAIDEIGCTLRTHISGTAADTTVRIEALPGQRLDRDFVVRIRTAAHRQPSLALLTSMDSDGQEGTFALTVLPPSVEVRPAAGRDVVVVVDVSASMVGWRLPAARRGAAGIIDTLTPADQFTVLTFAEGITHPEWAAAGLVQATERNRFGAIEHLFVAAAAGDPRLLSALDTATGLLTDPRRPSILVVITAGQVGNEDQIVAEFRPRTAAVRVHAVGIGATVNAGLLRQLAAAGRGQVLLADSDDALDDLTPALRRLLGPPLLTNLALAGEGIQLLPNTISPGRPPDIFSGTSAVITGRFRGNPTGGVVVSGTGFDGRPWASRVNAVPVGGRALTQLWARAFLADLQRRYLRCQIEEAAGLERLIVSTSLRFGVLTRLTAFVAVSNAPTRGLGAPRQVIQSVELPADWVEPDPSLSPYVREYARIRASDSDSEAGRGARPPAPKKESARVTVTGSAPIAAAPTGSVPITAAPTGSGPTQYADATDMTATLPPSAVPPPPAAAAAPATPPPTFDSPPSPPAAPMPAGYGRAPDAAAAPMLVGSYTTPQPASPPPAAAAAPRAAGEPSGYDLATSPPTEARRGRLRRGRYIGAGAAAAVALGVTVFGVTMLEQGAGQTASPSPTTAYAASPGSTVPGTGYQATPGSSTATSAPDSESASLAQLQQLAAGDRVYVSTQLADRWVPQLSSKRPGVVDDGVVWNNSLTLQEHLRLRQRYNAKLLWSGDWSTFDASDYWVTIVPITFSDSASALRWCSSQGFDADHCYAKLISTTHPVPGSIAHN